jgi:DNA-binding GntR family transcriptional regulator
MSTLTDGQSPAPDTPAVAAPGRATSHKDGYERLHADIVQGRVMPNERLIESDLIDSLGVSRAAVRIILAQLENEGLVVREPHRGARVRMVSEAEAFEITQTRAALESLVAQGAALRATDADIALMRGLLVEMRGYLEAGDLLTYSETNSRLHATVTAISQNQTAARLIAELQAQLVRFQYRTVLVVGRAKNSIAEHTEIVEAIAAHDPERAGTAMRVHLAHVAETLKDTTGARSQHTSQVATEPSSE